MNIQVRGSIQVKDGNKSIFSDVIIIDKEITEYDVRKITIAGGTTDLEINLGEVSEIKYVNIHCSLPMTFKVNDSPVETSRGTDFTFTGITGHGITKLQCSNPNTDNGELQLTIGG